MYESKLFFHGFYFHHACIQAKKHTLPSPSSMFFALIALFYNILQIQFFQRISIKIFNHPPNLEQAADDLASLCVVQGCGGDVLCAKIVLWASV